LQPQVLQGLSITKGALQFHTFTSPLQCLATAPDGSYYVATQTQLYRISWQGAEMNPQPLTTWEEDMPSIQKMAVTENGEVYLLTQEGIYHIPQGKPVAQYAPTVAADMQGQGQEVYVAESKVGVYSLTQPPKWIVKWE
jgi:hypothetical protein